jgi:hypothetical protein
VRAVRADGIERIPLPNHVDQSDRIEDSPALDGLGYPLALVEWHDAWFDHEQLAIEERRADYIVRTVGFLIDRSPKIVSVAQELLPDGEGFRAVTHIPAAVVERIVRIGPAS